MNILKSSILKTPKKLTIFVKYLDQRCKDGVTNCRKLFEELKVKGYSGSYGSLYYYLKQSPKRNYAPPKRIRRVETQPGEQAQVDFGYFKKIEVDGKKERLYAFVYVLSWSRMMYVEFVVKQTLPVLQQCHINAFSCLGIPKTIVYDNMKTVVKSREKLPNGNTKIHHNLGFLDFAKYYNFNIFLCPPYWPRSKGKVEAGVKYVRNNFMNGARAGRDFSSLKEINKMVLNWLENVANKRTHKTTGETPFERWNKEKKYLKFPHNFPAYPTSPLVARNSTESGMVQYKQNFYSVPMEFSRRKVLVKEISKGGIGFLKIYHEDELITTHKLVSGKGEWITKDEHLEINSLPKSINKRKKRQDHKNYEPNFARDLDYYNQLILRRKENE